MKQRIKGNSQLVLAHVKANPNANVDTVSTALTAQMTRKEVVQATARREGYYNRINTEIKEDKKRAKEEEKAKNEAASE